MIKFSLKCADDHRFDSWFQSSAAFEKLLSAGLVTCAHCGSSSVEKALMAPKVRNSKSSKTETPSTALTKPPDPREQALAEFKKQVEQNSEYVGVRFAQEARNIHDGTAPDRAIYGEARPEEARKLIKDGVPVTPLPFIPGRKSN